jgi:signal transduction histidine kinase
MLDLRGYDLDRKPAVRLDGDWAFYWGRLLEPAAFHGEAEPAADGVQALPGAWNGRPVAGRILGGKGCATLRLRLLTDPARAPMALRVTGMEPAFRLWVNGRLVCEGGRMGKDQRGPDLAQRLVPLTVDGRPMELVLQVSNATLRMAALLPIALGRESDLATAQTRQWGLALFVVGTLVFMGIYHLALYAFRRSERAPLYFGAYCLLWAGNMASIQTGGWAIRAFWPAVPGEVLYRTYQFCFFLSGPLGYQFLRGLFPREFPRWFLAVSWGVALPCALLAWVGQVPLISAILPGYDLMVAAKMAFFIWGLVLATLHRREGARIILAGFGVISLCGCNDMLNSLNLIHTPMLMLPGLLSFILAQALALSRRFAHLFMSVERLSSELARKNHALEEEKAERDRLAKEVITISEEERRRVSQELHDGLCQQLTGARMQCSVLESMAPQDRRVQEGLGKLTSLLEASEDQAYNLSHGLWPVELVAEDASAALADLVQRVSHTSNIPVHYQHQHSCVGCNNPRVSQLHHIAQEAIGNAIKHALASRINVTLDCRVPGAITLTVADDGVGWRKAKRTKGGLGLRMMIHRARMAGGEFRMEAPEGGGTNVVCQVPCEARP